MEENKELETTTEEQASVTPAANNGEKKGLFLSGLIVGFAATLLIVGGKMCIRDRPMRPA